MYGVVRKDKNGSLRPRLARAGKVYCVCVNVDKTEQYKGQARHVALHWLIGGPTPFSVLFCSVLFHCSIGPATVFLLVYPPHTHSKDATKENEEREKYPSVVFHMSHVFKQETLYFCLCVVVFGQEFCAKRFFHSCLYGGIVVFGVVW